jgi:hypothetical protein
MAVAPARQPVEATAPGSVTDCALEGVPAVVVVGASVGPAPELADDEQAATLSRRTVALATIAVRVAIAAPYAADPRSGGR